MLYRNIMLLPSGRSTTEMKALCSPETLARPYRLHITEHDLGAVDSQACVNVHIPIYEYKKKDCPFSQQQPILDIVGNVYYFVTYIYRYVVQQDKQCGINE